MAEERASVSIRISRSLLEKLKEAANARSHSMNAEIIQRLDDSLSRGSFLESAWGASLKDQLTHSPEEGALLRVWRALTDKEQEALRAVVDAFVDGRERARNTQGKSKE